MDSDLSAPKLELSPLEFRFSLDNEKFIERKFTVKNVGSSVLELKLYLESPAFLNNSYTELKDWITFSYNNNEELKSLELSLEPNEKIEIPFKLSIPESFSAGGKYAFIYAEVISDSSEEKGIKLSSRAGIKLFASSSKELIHGVKIEPLKTNFFELDKISVSSKIENTGNIDLTAISSFSVSSLFGRTLYSNSSTLEIYPESKKELYEPWSETPPIGLYRVSYSIKTLDTELNLDRLVLVSSPFFTILSIMFLLLTFFLGLKLHQNHQQKTL